MTERSAEEIKRAVADRYGAKAEAVVAGRTIEVVERDSEAGCCEDGCCVPAATDLSFVKGLYAADEVAGLPPEAIEAVAGCGNPTAIAELRPGEAVLDLGSGGGIDCFLAAKQVGPEGRVIGVDMTPAMINLARENARKLGATNVEFKLGEIEDLPLPDASVDVIISNCVINLSPDKDRVLREAARVLRPGGRLRVSDIVWTEPRPPDASDLESWAGCVAGALYIEDYLQLVRDAGFAEVRAEALPLRAGEDLASALIFGERLQG